MTDQDNSVSVETGTDKKFIGLVIGFLIWMVVAVAWFFSYPFAGGDGALIRFIVIFLWELLILGFGIIITAYVAINTIIEPNRPKI